MLGGCVRMVQAYHKASPLPASSKLWLKTSCARDCIFVLNCPRWTSLPWICLIAFWTYLDFWHPQHPVAMNSSLIMSCMKKYFPFCEGNYFLKKKENTKKTSPKTINQQLSLCKTTSSGSFVRALEETTAFNCPLWPSAKITALTIRQGCWGKRWSSTPWWWMMV